MLIPKNPPPLQNPSPPPQTQNPTETLTKPQLKALVLTQYSHGTFSNLVSNVLALHNVLLTNCQNITTPQPNNGLNSLDLVPSTLNLEVV